MEACIATRCLWAVTILKSLLCLSAGFSWLFSIWTHSCSGFFYRLTACTCWTAQGLGHTDANWTCWLAADARVLKHKHRFEHDSDSCHTVHQWYTAYKQYTTGRACCVYQWPTKGATAASWCWPEAEEEVRSVKFSRNRRMGTWRTLRKYHWGLYMIKKKFSTKIHFFSTSI